MPADPQVRDLQEALLAQGYRLPRWGADGDPGPETLAAVDRWAADHGVPGDATPGNLIPPEVAAAILAAVNLPALPPGLVDARHAHPRGQIEGRNPWKRIDCLCWHQMDCRGSTKPGWLRWSTGDLAIHYAACCDGSAAWLYDLNACLWHGHGFNGRSVGIEVEGLFAGVEGRASTFPRGHLPTVMTDAQVEAAKTCARHAVATVAAHGGKIRYVVAHRQSRVDIKQRDPGEQVWKRVVIPVAAEFGLEIGPTLRGGADIPEAWDPRKTGVRY